MITPILEQLILSGNAQVFQITLGQNGLNTINVPSGKSIVITNVNVQPFLGANLNFSYGFVEQAGNKVGVFDNISNYFNNGLRQQVNNGQLTDNNGILVELLNRGLFQIEFYSSDNQSILTYNNEYLPVMQNSNPSDEGWLIYVPIVTERNTDTYSIHKNIVHMRLRFQSKALRDGGRKYIAGSYTDIVDTQRDAANLIPEQRPILDVNSPDIFFQSAIFSNMSNTGKFGFYPFGVETNIKGASNLEQYQSSNQIILPYDDAGVSGNDKFTGLNGELAYYIDSSNTDIPAFLQLFVPYINVQYVLINNAPDGNTIVPANLYNTVTISK